MPSKIIVTLGLLAGSVLLTQCQTDGKRERSPSQCRGMPSKIIVTLGLLAGSVLLTQCQTLMSGGEGARGVPRVELEGVYHQEVVDACHEVFSAHDYVRAGQRGPRLLYERPGTTMEFLAWGGLSTDERLLNRLVVTIHDLGSDAFEVECQPFIVTHAGGHMEEARKVSRYRSGPYQRMLEEVRDRAHAQCLPGGVGGWDASVLD